MQAKSYHAEPSALENAPRAAHNELWRLRTNCCGATSFRIDQHDGYGPVGDLRKHAHCQNDACERKNDEVALIDSKTGELYQ